MKLTGKYLTLDNIAALYDRPLGEVNRTYHLARYSLQNNMDFDKSNDFSHLGLIMTDYIYHNNMTVDNCPATPIPKNLKHPW